MRFGLPRALVVALGAGISCGRVRRAQYVFGEWSFVPMIFSIGFGGVRRGLLGLGAAALTLAIAARATAQTSECAPKCRSGFTCVAGACVSACNPPCATGETCSAAGECVLTARATDNAPAVAASAPRNEPAPRSAGMILPDVDHHWEFAARVGYQFAGEVSPKDMYVGKTGGAPIAFLDASRVVHPLFTVGLFSQFSRANFQQYSSDTSLGDGHLTLWSAGTVLKVRIPVSESFTVRVGGLLGANFIWASGKSYGGVDYKGHGVGFDLGPTVEGALRLSQHLGASAQFAFSSQILMGSVSVDGDPNSHDLSYAPIAFLTIGPELYL